MKSTKGSILSSIGRTASVSSSTASGYTSTSWGGTQATLAPGNERQNNDATGNIYIRFIDPENALSAQKISAIPAHSDPIQLLTKLSELKLLVKTKFFGKGAKTDFAVDLHLPAHPIISNDDATLYDYDLVGTQRTPYNLFVVLRYTGDIGTAQHFGDDMRSTSNASAWHPVPNTTKASIATFCSSLEIMKRKVVERSTQRSFLMALWQTTHFLPAVYAMSSLFDSKSLTREEKAALCQTFQSLCIRAVPEWATNGGKVENALEGSRQIIGWLLDQVMAQKRGGSGKEEWTSKAIIKIAPNDSNTKKKDDDEKSNDGSISAADDIITIGLQNGDTLKVTVEIADRNAQSYADPRQLALAFRNCYSFDGNEFLVFPKGAGNFLEHRLLHHIKPDGFYEQIINTTNLPQLSTVAPLSLSTSRPPVLTLNDQGLLSIFEFGGDCAVEWARLWNPVTGVQKIMSNDQGQGLAKTLQSIIKSRKLNGAWPLDGWDAGSLNASTVDTRKPREAVIICIDASSSMYDPSTVTSDNPSAPAAEVLSRMTAAKTVFKHYATTTSNYKLPVWFGVMRFNAIPVTMQMPTPLLADIEPAIEAIEPCGMTAMWDCINDAAETLLDFKDEFKFFNTRLRIIVLTDGEDNKSIFKSPQVYEKLWENDIVLDAIVFGENKYFVDLLKISSVTGGYAMKPQTTSELIQIAEMETMVDQSLRPPICKATYLPFWDTIQAPKPFTVSAFSYPPSRDHPNQDDEFMSLTAASKVLGGKKGASLGGVTGAEALKTKRLLLEVKDILDNPHPEMDVYISEANMAFWKIVMQGPAQTVYENGTFVVFLDMTDDFPRKAPNARFITPIIHPNVNKHGRICHAILDQDWKAETKVRDILCCAYGLLMAPERNEPVDAIATMKYWTEEKLYSEEIAQHIKRFASVSRKDWAHRIVPDLDAIPGAQPVKTGGNSFRQVLGVGLTNATPDQSNKYNVNFSRNPYKATATVQPPSSATTTSAVPSSPATAVDSPAPNAVLQATPPLSRNPSMSSGSGILVSVPDTPTVAQGSGSSTSAAPSSSGNYVVSVTTKANESSIPRSLINVDIENEVAPSIHSTSSSRSSISMRLKKVFNKKSK